MKIFRFIKNKYLYKRSLALLLAVMVLLSTAEMLIMSVFAQDNTVYDGAAYTLKSTGINFIGDSGDLTYTFYRKLPAYTYTTVDEVRNVFDNNGEPVWQTDENGNPIQAEDENGNPVVDEHNNPVYVQQTVTVTVISKQVDNSQEATWQQVSLEPSMYDGVQQHDTADNLIYKIKHDDSGTWNDTSKDIIEEAIAGYARYAVVSESENSMRIVVPEGTGWKEIVVTRQDENSPWSEQASDPAQDFIASANSEIKIRQDDTNELKVTLAGKTTENQALLFMMPPDEDTVLSDGKTVTLNTTNNEVDFIVQAPEQNPDNRSKTLVKRWQDNSALKVGDQAAFTGKNIYIGVKYQDEKSNTKILIPAAPTLDQNNQPVQSHNEAQNALFYVSGSELNNLRWLYVLESHYIYNANGTERKFELFETNIPSGYIQVDILDENGKPTGDIANIKQQEYKAYIDWRDGDNDYQTRITPAEWAEKIQGHVYKRVGNGVNEPVAARYIDKGLKTKIQKKNSDGTDQTDSDIAVYNTVVNDENTNHYKLDAAPNDFSVEPKTAEETDEQYIERYNQAVRAYNESVDAYNAAIRNDEGILIVTTDPENPDRWVIRMPNTMGYDVEGNPYSYLIKQKEIEKTDTQPNGEPLVSDNPSQVIGTGNQYVSSVLNNGNYSTLTDDGLYNDGVLTNTLSGETECKILKYWGDNGVEPRPDNYTFDIRRYVDGKDYTKSDILSESAINISIGEHDDVQNLGNRAAGITEYIFKVRHGAGDTSEAWNQFVDKDSHNDSRAVKQYNVPVDSMPKFDASGRMFIYYIEEKGGDGTYATSHDTTGRDENMASLPNNANLPDNCAMSGDMLKNVLTGTTGQTVTKTWVADARRDKSDSSVFYVERFKYILSPNNDYAYEDLSDPVSIQQKYIEINANGTTTEYEKMYLLYERTQDGKYRMLIEDDGTGNPKYIDVDLNEPDKDHQPYIVSIDEGTQTAVVCYYYVDTDTNVRTHINTKATFSHKYVEDICIRDNNGNATDLKYDRADISGTMYMDDTDGTIKFKDNLVRPLRRTGHSATRYFKYSHPEVLKPDGTVQTDEQGNVVYDNTKFKVKYAGNLLIRTWDQLYEIDNANGTAKTIVEYTQRVKDDAATQTALDNAIQDIRNQEIVDLATQTLAVLNPKYSDETTALNNLSATVTPSLNVTLNPDWIAQRNTALQTAIDTFTAAQTTFNNSSKTAADYKTYIAAQRAYQTAIQQAHKDCIDGLKADGVLTDQADKDAVTAYENALFSEIEPKGVFVVYNEAVADTLSNYDSQLPIINARTANDYGLDSADYEVYRNVTLKREQVVDIVYDYVTDINQANVYLFNHQEDDVTVQIVSLVNPNSTETNTETQKKPKFVAGSTTGEASYNKKSEPYDNPYATILLDGFSQDVTTKTKDIGMPRYDNDGYEYVYRVYEGEAKTKDDVTYSKIEQMDGYRLITTDKGYQYESRETFINGSPVVVNKLIGDTHIKTTKGFSGPFPAGDYIIKFNIYCNGKLIGTTHINVTASDAQRWNNKKKKWESTSRFTSNTAGVVSNGNMFTLEVTQDSFYSVSGGKVYSWVGEGKGDYAKSGDTYTPQAGGGYILLFNQDDCRYEDGKMIFPRYDDQGISYTYDIVENGMYPEGSNEPLTGHYKVEYQSSEEFEIGDSKNSQDTYLQVTDTAINYVGEDSRQVQFDAYKQYRDEEQTIYRRNVYAELQYCQGTPDGLLPRWETVRAAGDGTGQPGEFTINWLDRFTHFDLDVDIEKNEDDTFTQTGPVLPGVKDVDEANNKITVDGTQVTVVRDNTNSDPNVFLVDALIDWINMKKEAFKTDSAVGTALQEQYGSEYNANTTYYYHKDYGKNDGDGNPYPQFTTDKNEAALEDRLNVKCADKKGNFRVVEKALNDNGTRKNVQHEYRLVADELIGLLNENEGSTALYNAVVSYLGTASDEDKTKVETFFIQNNIIIVAGENVSTLDSAALKNYVVDFLTTHSDEKILRWFQWMIKTENAPERFPDLTALVKDLLKNLFAKLPAFVQYHNDKMVAAHLTTNIGAYVDSLSTPAEVQDYLTRYFTGRVDQFCADHPEHHKGNSFVETVDQNYDVTPYAEVKFSVGNESKGAFEFGLVNTRVGEETIKIEKTWVDGYNNMGVRPAKVSYLLTSTDEHSFDEFATAEPIYYKDSHGNTRTIQKTADGSGGYYSHFTDENGNIMTLEKVTDSEGKIYLRVTVQGNPTSGKWDCTIPYLPKYSFALPTDRTNREDSTDSGYGDYSDGTSITYTLISNSETFLNEDGTEYYDMYGYSRTREEEIVEKRPQNHTGDVFNEPFVSALSSSVDLIVNVYWMDEDDSQTRMDRNIRPVPPTFTLYRSYLKFRRDEQGNVITDEQGNPQTQFVVEPFSMNSAPTPILQNVYDEKWRGYNFGSVPKYNGDGFPINYYIAEDSFNKSDYKNTETYLGEPTKYYIDGIAGEDAGTKHFTTNYNAEEYVLVDGKKHFIHYPKVFTIDENTVINVTDPIGQDKDDSNTYNILGKEHLYIELANGTKKYIYENGALASGVTVQDGQVVYQGKQYPVFGTDRLYIQSNEQRKVFLRDKSGVSKTDGYTFVNGTKYNLKSTTNSGGSNESSIQNYKTIKDRTYVIKPTGNTVVLANQERQYIKPDGNSGSGYIAVAPFLYDSKTGNYLDGTIVNRPHNSTNIAGEKIWSNGTLPQFNQTDAYDNNLLPDMTLTLYRYSYDEIAAMRAADAEVDAQMRSEHTNYDTLPEEQQAAINEQYEYLKMLKPVKDSNGNINYNAERKYPKSVDGDHLLRYKDIVEFPDGAAVNQSVIDGKKYTVQVTKDDGTSVTSDSVSLAVSSPISPLSKDADGKISFGFHDYRFDRYDEFGKTYTYVLQEGYVTTVDVWRYTEDPETHPNAAGTKVLSYTLDDSRLADDAPSTITIDKKLPATQSDGTTPYYYKIVQVDGTEALDENYTFAYDLVQNEDNGFNIVNLYNREQSLSIKLKKAWQGLPQKLDPSEYPTSTFKLVRYVQSKDAQGNWVKYDGINNTINSKQDVTYFPEDFALQKYIMLDGERVYIQNRMQVIINDYPTPYRVTDDGTRLEYNDMTQVTDGKVSLGGREYTVQGTNGYIEVDNAHYSIVRYNGQEYVHIPVSQSQYILVGSNDSKVYVRHNAVTLAEGVYDVINGNIEIPVTDNHVTVNGQNYSVVDSYVTMSAKTKYHVENQKMIIPVKTLEDDRYVELHYKEYSVQEIDDEYFATLTVNDTKQYFDIKKAGEDEYVLLPMNGNSIKIGNTTYYNNNGTVTIGENDYSVVDGNLKIPLNASTGYTYNYHLNKEGEVVSVDIVYRGSVSEEIELKWKNLAYYAPNMYPYVYDIEEIGVTEGFNVSPLAQGNEDADYQDPDKISNTSEDDTDSAPKTDYASEVNLPETKNNKTVVSVGMVNTYGKTTGSVKLGKSWKKDNLFQSITPQPDTLDVYLYRTLYNRYVNFMGETYPVMLQKYIVVNGEKRYVYTTINDDGSTTLTVQGSTYNEETGRFKVGDTEYPIQTRQEHIVVDGKIYYVENNKVNYNSRNYDVTDGNVTIGSKTYPVYNDIECVIIDGTMYQIAKGEAADGSQDHFNYDDTTKVANSSVTIGDYDGTFNTDHVVFRKSSGSDTADNLHAENTYKLGSDYYVIINVDNKPDYTQFGEMRSEEHEGTPYNKNDVAISQGATAGKAVDYLDTFKENQTILPFTLHRVNNTWAPLEIQNLQIYSPNGQKYYYYIVEKVPSGYYQSEWAEPVAAVKTEAANENSYQTTDLDNTVLPATVKATKKWVEEGESGQIGNQWTDEEMLFASKLSGIAKNITYRLAYSTREVTLDEHGNVTSAGSWSIWDFLKSANNQKHVEIDGHWYEADDNAASVPVTEGIKLAVKQERDATGKLIPNGRFYVEDNEKHYFTNTNNVYTLTLNGSNLVFANVYEGMTVLKENIGSLRVKTDTFDSSKKYVEYYQDGHPQKRYITDYVENTMILSEAEKSNVVGNQMYVSVQLTVKQELVNGADTFYINDIMDNSKHHFTLSGGQYTVEIGGSTYVANNLTVNTVISPTIPLPVQTDNAGNKYVQYYQDGVLETQYETKSNAGQFNDITWDRENGYDLPQYERENGKLYEIRYMPIEYGLAYSQENYEDTAVSNAEYNREVSPGQSDAQILANLNSDNTEHDSFAMGFVQGTSDYNAGGNQSDTVNTVKRQKLTIVKDWGDEFNRDDLRGDFTLQFKITRNNINYCIFDDSGNVTSHDQQEVIVVLSQEDELNHGESNVNPNIWTKSYYVPITSNFSNEVLSTYTVEELGPADNNYKSDFDSYKNLNTTGELTDYTNLAELTFGGSGRFVDVGSLDSNPSVIHLTTTVEPVDRYAAFRNTKKRLEFELKPSKLWYNVNGDKYPDKKNDASVEMPPWTKNIFFPDGDPAKLRIRFYLEYQVVEPDRDLTANPPAEADWKEITVPNDSYSNAKGDLAGVEPYLEFTVDDKGEISPVVLESWKNLPKHYYTESIKVHKNYLYRIREVLVRDVEDIEVSTSDMLYYQSDSNNLNVHTSAGSLTKYTDSNGYVYVKVDGKDYYVKATSGGKTNYVTYKNSKYYIAVGTEAEPTAEKEFDVVYAPSYINGDKTEGVVINGKKYYVTVNTTTHKKQITVGSTTYEVKTRWYYLSGDTKTEVQANQVNHGMVTVGNTTYEALCDEYIEIGNDRKYLESVEKVETTNTVNKAKASVSKTWTGDDGNKYSTRPDKIMYELQYRPKDGSEEWTNVEEDWLFNIASDGTQINGFSYQEVDHGKMYIKLDGKKYNVMTDIDRKYVEINGEKIYVVNNKVKIGGTDYTVSGNTVTVNQTFAVQTAVDDDRKYIVVNGDGMSDRIYVSDNTVTVNNQSFSVVNNTVTINTLTLQTESNAPMEVYKKSDGTGYYIIENGVNKPIDLSTAALYIKGASSVAAAGMYIRTAGTKTTVSNETVDGKPKLYIETYAEAALTGTMTKLHAQEKETFYIEAAPTAVITVENLPAVDAENRPVKYRFTESYLKYNGENDSVVYVAMPSDNALYQKTSETTTETTDETDNCPSFATAVTNQLQTTVLKIKKTWGKDLYRMADNVASVDFKIQRRVNNGTWEDLTYSGNRSKTIAVALDSQTPVKGQGNDYNKVEETVVGWTGLPKYDNQHNEYEYRAAEVSLMPTGENAQSVAVTQQGTVGSFSYSDDHAKIADGYQSVLTNTPIVSKLAVTKAWDDDHNREAVRREIKLTITATVKDGEEDVPAGVTFGEMGEITVANGYWDSENKKLYTNADDAKVGTSPNAYYPDNYYYIWYGLPIKDVNGKTITYTVTEPKTDLYSASVTTSQDSTGESLDEDSTEENLSGSVTLESKCKYEYDNSTLTNNAMPYDTTESALVEETQQLKSDSEIPRIDFVNTHTPRTVTLNVVKVWRGDDGLEEHSRPPQGMKYILKYKYVGSASPDWATVPTTGNANETWQQIYSLTGLNSEKTVGDNVTYPLAEGAEHWNFTWENLPLYEKGKIGAKFEYFVEEKGIDYNDGSGRDGLYNYMQFYSDDEGTTYGDSVALTGDVEVSSNTGENILTEYIKNELTRLVIKKEIDPGYLGNTKPALYDKTFHFQIKITDGNNHSIHDLKIKLGSRILTDDTSAYNSATGELTVDLKHNDEVAVYNLPTTGVTVRVEEDDYALQGFNAYVQLIHGDNINGDTIIDKGKTRTVTESFKDGQHEILYINRVTPLPATGGSGLQIFFEVSLGLITMGAIIGIFYWLSRRKQLDDELLSIQN